jgi:hypothetical protein
VRLGMAAMRVAAVCCVLVALAGCGSSKPTTASHSGTTSSGRPPLRMVEMGDSWIAGDHCGHCRTFAGVWADDIHTKTGHPVQITDLTGAKEPSSVESKTSGSLLALLLYDKQTQQLVANADIVLVSTGGNDLEPIGDKLIHSTCGGPDDAHCIRNLGQLWHRNFDGIVKAIAGLRGSKPTAIRVLAEGNFFLGSEDLNSLVPKRFALTGGQLMAELYVKAVCEATKAYHAKCIDGRPILSGPHMDQRFDENSAGTFRKLADALDAESLAELGLNTT